MMILGFIVTTASAGHALDPFSPTRLIVVSSAVSVIAVVLTLAGVWNIEAPSEAPDHRMRSVPQRQSSFHEGLAEVWREPEARRLAVFIFVSMLAYSAQDLILEPFAGAVFGMTPGETTRLSGVQHTGALIGMVLVPAVNALMPAWRARTTAWIVGGCIASALALFSLSLSAAIGPAWPLRASVLALGITNGVYAIAAIGAMMNLVGAGHHGREGTRMGLWGAAQAIAFGLGGFLGTMASDSARFVTSSIPLSYALVFAAEAGLFVISGYLAVRIGRPAADEGSTARDTSPANQGVRA
jgi:BCD family chlorophyll transporter-like MFS transporter